MNRPFDRIVLGSESGAGDIARGFGLAMKLGATVNDLAGMHHAFPTLRGPQGGGRAGF